MQPCAKAPAGDVAETWCSLRGSVGELQQKHLLAKNLRRAPDADLWVPRGFFMAHNRINAAGGGSALAAAMAVVCGEDLLLSPEEV